MSMSPKPSVVPFPQPPRAVETVSKRPNLRYLWVYAIGLFAAAIVLMLLSLLSQTQREGYNALSSAQQHSASVLQRVDDMQTENENLREQIAELQREIAALESRLAEINP